MLSSPDVLSHRGEPASLSVGPESIGKSLWNRRGLEDAGRPLHADDLLLAPSYYLFCVLACRPPILEGHRNSILAQVGESHPDYDLVKCIEFCEVIAGAPGRDQAESACHFR